MAFADENIKDVILQTLAELESDVDEISKQTKDLTKRSFENIQKPQDVGSHNPFEPKEISLAQTQQSQKVPDDEYNDLLKNLSSKISQTKTASLSKQDEVLIKMRERMLVLFKGLQQARQDDPAELIEKKLDMTLCYLQYSLSLIDECVEQVSIDLH